MKNPTLFIGPMSKNIVDAVIEYSNRNNVTLGLIPSRRQVDMNGGYVNNWTTEQFCSYVKEKTSNVLITRDHSGPNQGSRDDDGLDSFINDCSVGQVDVIHIDVWKKYPALKDGLKTTIDWVNIGYDINPNVFYEVGTEESIRRFSPEDLDLFLRLLKEGLDKKFDQIKYAVIQSGTALKEGANVGIYDKNRLESMLKVVKKYGLTSKEHNGDFLSIDTVKEKFKIGLDSINIAPEFGQIETSVILNEMEKNYPEFIDIFFEICHNSKKWEKWVDKNFNPLKDKIELIKICGHYVFSYNDFKKIKSQMNVELDMLIKREINKKIEFLL